MIFAGRAPSWMRVYECLEPRAPVLLKTLTALRREAGLVEYIDVAEDIPGRSCASVYVLARLSVQNPKLPLRSTGPLKISPRCATASFAALDDSDGLSEHNALFLNRRSLVRLFPLRISIDQAGHGTGDPIQAGPAKGLRVQD